MDTIRILHIVTIMNRGGLETMLMNYYRKINRDRIQFDFLVHRQEEGAYDKEILALGGKIYRMPPINPIKHHIYLSEVKKFFNEHNEYQIIHSHINTYSMYIIREAKKHNIPVRIVHSHIAKYKLDKKLPFYLYTKFKVHAYVTDKFTCGEEAGQWLFGNKVNNVKVLPNAIDSKKFIFCEKRSKELRQQLNLENKFIIGHIGRFNEQKNHVFLINIFNEIYKKNKNARLILVGEGKLKNKIEKQIKDMGLENVVYLLGVREDIPDILMLFDVLLFPSLYEGLPVSIIEAQASGVRCILSDKVAKETAITNLVEFIGLEESIDVWRDRVLKYVNGYKRINRYSELVKAGYDIENNVKWLEEFYINSIIKKEKAEQ